MNSSIKTRLARLEKLKPSIDPLKDLYWMPHVVGYDLAVQIFGKGVADEMTAECDRQGLPLWDEETMRKRAEEREAIIKFSA